MSQDADQLYQGVRGNWQVAMVALQKPSQSWCRDRHCQSSQVFFFSGLSRLSSLFLFFVLWCVCFLWDLDVFGPASRQERVARGTVLFGEKPGVTTHSYFNPPMAVLLVPKFSSHFGKKTHFLSPCSCYPLLFWHRPFWRCSKQHELVQASLERKSAVRG